MASRNSRKPDVENSFYHVYNRGVEKRSIFEDHKDYKVFLKYTEEYLSPPPSTRSLKKDVTFKDTVFKGVARQPKNYHKDIELLAYCLMPNHFHFLLKQIKKGSMQEFLHSLSIRYSMYFNRRHKRVGPLFQGRYKAVLIDEDSQLLYLSKYVHVNPSGLTSDLTKALSSYPEYLKLRETKWLKTGFILKYFEAKTSPEFKKYNSYKKFVETYDENLNKKLDKLTLELPLKYKPSKS